METVADSRSVTPASLAAMIDHTFLKAFATPGDIEKLCEEAREHRFATVAVTPAEVSRCVRLLAGSGVRVGAGVGFPLGQNTPETKAFETRDAVDRGAKEIDTVLNIRALQGGCLDIVRREMRDLVAMTRPAGAVSKVILETFYLTDAQKTAACRLALEEGVDFVKTSTGTCPGGATVADVRLMRSVVGDRAQVKASGGIRNLESALAMIAAGATRLGTSQGVAIVDELRSRLGSGVVGPAA